MWWNFQRKGIVWGKKCMPTYKKVSHSGFRTPQGTQLILPSASPFNLGNPDLFPTEFQSVRQFFFFTLKSGKRYEICLDVSLVPRTKQRFKRRKCVCTAKPVKKTLTLKKPGWFHKITVSASHWCSHSVKNNVLCFALSAAQSFFSFGEFLFSWGLMGTLNHQATLHGCLWVFTVFLTTGRLFYPLKWVQKPCEKCLHLLDPFEPWFIWKELSLSIAAT